MLAGVAGDATGLFQAERRRLFGLAYRLLGSAADAEDVLQAAFEQWIASDHSAVATPGAWLTTVVTNLCLNQLGSARAQRERYAGTWLPEPVVTSDGALGPLETAEQRDSVSLGPRGKAQVGRAFARLVRTDAPALAGRSTQQWIDALGLGADAAMVVAAFVRVATYVADLSRLPAVLAVAQMRTGLQGVEYLDGGWEQLTSGLLACATAAGAQIRPHAPAQQISGGPGGWEVHTAAGVIRAAAVVVAAGRPDATRRLLPAGPGWDDTGPEVTAACLDLGLRRPGPRFVLGIDEPLYLSPHSPPGDLAPPGCGLVHLMRYGATDPARDRQQLWGMAEAAGITQAEVVVQRFLPRMVVVNRLPPPERGLAGRPPVAAPGAPGVFMAGDWVGPDGWLCDASLASGEQAGHLAAAAARQQFHAAAGQQTIYAGDREE
jgi:hypothetical protein